MKTMKSNSKETNRIKKPSKLAIKFANTVFVLGILFSVLVMVYAVYRIYNPKYDGYHYASMQYIFIIISGISATIFVLSLKLSNHLKVNLSLLFVTIGISFYSFEIYLNILDLTEKCKTKSRPECFEDEGAKWDYRTKLEYINYLKKETNNPFVYGRSVIGGLLASDFFLNIIDEEDLKQINKWGGGGIFPFTNISNSTIVHCNESGIWQFYESDEYGFNNPINIIQNSNATNITLIGDSFVEGHCVSGGKDIGSKLRELGFNVHNLGQAGGGVIFYNAIYREYSRTNSDFTPDYVLMFLYFENDLNDTYDEFSNTLFRKYIDNRSFNQNLINRQDESDELQKEFFKLVSDPKFGEKYPKLSHLTPKRFIKDEKMTSNYLNINQIKSFLMITKLRRLLTPIIFVRRREIERIFKQIEMINKEISEDAKLIIVYLPTFNEIKTGNNIFSNLVTNKLNQLNIDYIDMNSKFIEYKLNTIFYYGLGGHYSAEGYGIIAKEIDKKINENVISPKINK